jgi:pimeloyl-ACP methyl ester carboxylesterase
MLPDPIAASAFVDIPGVRLAYDTAGRGAPVVFLHGGLLDRRQWDAQFDFFATNYRAIRYDMRSSGQSETTPTSQPFTHHEDLLRFLGALKISRVLLVGHSNYAVALDFTMAYPELVEKLVLVSPGLRGYKFRDAWVGRRIFLSNSVYRGSSCMPFSGGRFSRTANRLRPADDRHRRSTAMPHQFHRQTRISQQFEMPNLADAWR